MTENNTMSLEEITRALTELAKHVETIRGGESEPELDPSDPLNEILPESLTATDSLNSDDRGMNRILDSSGEPRTIRNVLKAYTQVSVPDGWYTIRSVASDKRYRISEVRHHRVTSPSGSSRPVHTTHDFGVYLYSSEELSAGWVVEGVAKVLDTYERAGKQYLIYELLS